MEKRLERVLTVLEEQGGYRPVRQPLQVVDVDFKFGFDAVLVGPQNQDGLVIVLSAEDAPSGSLQRKVKAFILLLERTGSTRPVSLVLLTAEQSTKPVAALEAICRVILVPDDAEPEQALHPLLPLTIPAVPENLESAEDAINFELGSDAASPLVSALLRAARKGPEDVRDIVRSAVDNVAAKLQWTEGSL